MIIIALDLPADVEAKAQKRGLLAPAAFESFIRASLEDSDKADESWVCPICGKTEHIPNAETAAAIREGDAMMRGEIPARWYESLDEMWEALHK